MNREWRLDELPARERDPHTNGAWQEVKGCSLGSEALVDHETTCPIHTAPCFRPSRRGIGTGLLSAKPRGDRTRKSGHQQWSGWGRSHHWNL